MFITHVHPYGEVQFSPLGFVPRGSDPRPQRILTSPPAVRAAPASVRRQRVSGKNICKYK